MTLKMGKNAYIENEAYHADREFLSSSAVKLLLDDEIEYFNKYVKGEKVEGKEFFDFGSLVHTMRLEPHLVQEEFAIFPGDKRNRAEYAEFCEANEGKIIMTANDYKAAAKLVAALKRHRLANKLLDEGEPEIPYCTKLEGVPVKIKCDMANVPLLVADLKTSSKPLNRRNLEEVCDMYDYDLSAAFYLDVLNKVCKTEMEDFYFVFINKKSCQVKVAKASKSMIARGRKKYKEGLKKYKRLTKSGFFDKIDMGEEYITLE